MLKGSAEKRVSAPLTAKKNTSKPKKKNPPFNFRIKETKRKEGGLSKIFQGTPYLDPQVP